MMKYVLSIMIVVILVLFACCLAFIFSFKFDREEKIFYTHEKAFQRIFGFCDFYDSLGKLILNLNEEIVNFEYNNYYWRIEFWKGSYLIGNGCEIGIYRCPAKSKSKYFFRAVKDDDMLEMSCCLKIVDSQEYRTILKRSKIKTWWLNGFKLSMNQIQPDALMLEASIIFPNVEMRDAFISGITEIKSQNIKEKHMGNEVNIIWFN